MTDPVRVFRHDLCGIPGILPRDLPRFWMLLPPFHRLRVTLCPGQRLQVSTEGVDEGAVGLVRRGSKAEHGVGSGDGTVGFNVGRNVDFVFQA
jgi:hypothetical protein